MNDLDIAQMNASLLHDAVERMRGHATSEYLCCSNIRPISHYGAIAGPAHTIRLSRAHEQTGDERAKVMTAYDESPSGTIVMVEVVGNLGGGVVGDVVANRLKQIGVKAIVVDGCTRDVLGCVEHGVPVWSREVSMAGMVPYEVHAEINVPINCGGVLVHPGDLIAADMDGVFVCPQSFAPEAVRLVNEFASSETKTHEALRKGTTILNSYPSKAKHPINE